jgi:hypothetical protein
VGKIVYNAKMKLFIGGMIFLCGALLALTPHTVMAQSQSGQISVGGTVVGPPPSIPPTIEEPLANSVFTEKQIQLKGSCLDGLIVKIFRNGIFGGSALCQPDNTFTIAIDLFEDQDDLVARQFDLLEQPSPDSTTVTVFYNPPQPIEPTPEENTAKFRLIIDYNYNFQGVFVDEPFHLPIHFIGGTVPYAVSVAWGDGTSNVFSREDTTQFYADHTYEKAGAHNIEIRVSDAGNDEAYLQFVLIVNGGIAKATPLPNAQDTCARVISSANVMPIQPEPAPTSAVLGWEGSCSGGNDITISWAAAIATTVTTSAVSFAGGFALAFFWDKLPALWQNIRLRIRGPKI